MRSNFERRFFACYEDADDAGADTGADAGAAGAAGAGGAAAGTGETVKSQAELNAVLKREKEKFRKEREKIASDLEKYKNMTKLTDEQRQQYEAQIEELRSAHLTTEERVRQQQAKMEKEWTGKLEAETNKAKNWESRYQDLQIGYDITSAATEAKVVPQSVILVEALLRPKTRLVPDVDEEGNETGTFTAKVKFNDTNKDGKPVVLDLTIKEAVARMKELPEQFGNLFEGESKGGMGGSTGKAGKKPDLNNMSTEDYMKTRKKDPSSVGL